VSDPQVIIARLWERFRPLVDERLERLQTFADGGGGAEEARRAAHNLAGALGSYGKHEASAVAREIDHAFLEGTAEPASGGEALGRLRATLA
jgi:HPt (histidine-containing phosphotransfer) domain-containing protein